MHANIAHPRAPLDDPLMGGFMERVDEIDNLAHGWPGFVTQPTLPDEGQHFPAPLLVNVSVWASMEPLRAYTLTGEHARMLDRRAEWFVQSERPTYVLYWAPADEPVTEAAIKRRLDHLIQHGPTPYAFDFKKPFTVDEMLAYQAAGGAPAGAGR